jgi:hypothetical protein
MAARSSSRQDRRSTARHTTELRAGARRGDASLGARKRESFDVRFVATHRDLLAGVARRIVSRADLYYRLAVAMGVPASAAPAELIFGLQRIPLDAARCRQREATSTSLGPSTIGCSPRLADKPEDSLRRAAHRSVITPLACPALLLPASSRSAGDGALNCQSRPRPLARGRRYQRRFLAAFHDFPQYCTDLHSRRRQPIAGSWAHAGWGRVSAGARARGLHSPSRAPGEAPGEAR